MTKKYQKELIENFESRIVRNANEKGCWHFLGVDRKKTSVDFYVKGKRHKAKRFAYELLKEKIPEKLSLYCTCQNNLCINPDHQIAGDRTQIRKILYSHGWKLKSGWKHKPEALKKISRAHKGKTISQETRERLRSINLGHVS